MASSSVTWVSSIEAAGRLGCIPKQVPRLAAKGFITVRRLPGCDPRYLLSDIERLATRATILASCESIHTEVADGPAKARENEFHDGPASGREGGRS